MQTGSLNAILVHLFCSSIYAMECIKSIARSIEFIEANLRTPLSVEDIAAQVASYSLYHFVRLFRIVTGETPGSYLRKRRLTEAAREIVESGRSLIDIAFDYQYQSQEAFSRSFKRHFGITPGAQRQTRQFLHLTPRAVLWEDEVNDLSISPPQILAMPALLLAGVAYHGDNSDGALATVWQVFTEQFKDIPHQVMPPQFYGLWRYPDSFQTTRDFDYLAATVVHKPPRGISVCRLGASRYALFEHHGPIQQIRQTYTYAYGEWLPQSGYQLAAQYDLERYDERFAGPDSADSVLSILILIQDQPAKIAKIIKI